MEVAVACFVVGGNGSCRLTNCGQAHVLGAYRESTRRHKPDVSARLPRGHDGCSEPHPWDQHPALRKPHKYPMMLLLNMMDEDSVV
jgi:hypothetical protein